MTPASCSDGVKDGNETDLDCGGGVCSVCPNGKSCVTSADCASGSCVNHVCMTPPVQCTDGVQNGSETDVDCGGGTCATCPNGKMCQVAADCTSSACVNHTCAAPPSECRDGAKDGNETDVDCGGDTCAPCPNGKACLLLTDCQSANCNNHLCATPAAGCLDNVKDGNESDIDCGGGTCAPCSNGKSCVAPPDCQSGSCINHVCTSTPAMCLNNIKDGNESDIDCGGGTCPACSNGKTCNIPTDCQSGVCASGKCTSPPAMCLDNVKDGNETDIDCGGGTCPPCIDGKQCSVRADCQSGVCGAGNRCTTPPPQCLNNVRDANETDVDCGGGVCPPCINGKSCILASDCASGFCDATNKCAPGGSAGSGGSGGGGSGGSGGGTGGCAVNCSASTCGCSASCNGHTYGLSCLPSSQNQGVLNCTCVMDGQSVTGPTVTATCSDLSTLFSEYSSHATPQCGFPGTPAM
jgi:hypothetical protein